MVQRAMFEDRAVWVRNGDDSWREGALSPIAWLEDGQFDASRPGLPGEPGARIDIEREINERTEAACGPMPHPEAGDDAWQTWDSCAGNLSIPEAAEWYWNRVVPASRYPEFQMVETVLGSAAGGLAIMLTFPVVARRKPS
jgi:hypothetical protein